MSLIPHNNDNMTGLAPSASTSGIANVPPTAETSSWPSSSSSSMNVLSFLIVWLGVLTAAVLLSKYGELFLDMTAVLAFSGYIALLVIDLFQRPGPKVQGAICIVVCFVVLFLYVRVVAKKLKRQRAGAGGGGGGGDGGGGVDGRYVGEEGEDENGDEKGDEKRDEEPGQQDGKLRHTALDFNFALGSFFSLEFNYLNDRSET